MFMRSSTSLLLILTIALSTLLSGCLLYPARMVKLPEVDLQVFNEQGQPISDATVDIYSTRFPASYDHHPALTLRSNAQGRASHSLTKHWQMKFVAVTGGFAEPKWLACVEHPNYVAQFFRVDDFEYLFDEHILGVMQLTNGQKTLCTEALLQP